MRRDFGRNEGGVADDRRDRRLRERPAEVFEHPLAAAHAGEPVVPEADGGPAGGGTQGFDGILAGCVHCGLGF